MVRSVSVTCVTLLIAEEDLKSPSMAMWATRTPMDVRRSRTPCTTGTSSQPTSWPTRRSSQSAQCARPYSSSPSKGRTPSDARVLKESFKHESVKWLVSLRVAQWVLPCHAKQTDVPLWCISVLASNLLLCLVMLLNYFFFITVKLLNYQFLHIITLLVNGNEKCLIMRKMSKISIYNQKQRRRLITQPYMQHYWCATLH